MASLPCCPTCRCNWRSKATLGRGTTSYSGLKRRRQLGVAHKAVVAQVVIVVADKDVENHAGKQLFGIGANLAGCNVLPDGLGQIAIAFGARCQFVASHQSQPLTKRKPLLGLALGNAVLRCCCLE